MLLRTMIREFENMIVGLDGQIATEEDRTRIKDRAHPAYSTLAVAAAKRRQNLFISLSQVRSILEIELRNDGSSHPNPPPSRVFAASSPPEAVEVQMSKRDPWQCAGGCGA
jgi:hypothetical protein